jgi:hypothetical protein
VPVLQFGALQLALTALLPEQRLVGPRLRDVPYAYAGRIVSGGRVMDHRVIAIQADEQLLKRFLDDCLPKCNPDNCDAQQLVKRFRELAKIKERATIVAETMCSMDCGRTILAIDDCLACGLSEVNCGNPDYCCSACRALPHEKAKLFHPERLYQE